MTRHPLTRRTALTIASCLASLLLGTAPAAHAAGTAALSVENGWVRWLPNNLPAAGYLTIKNNGDKAVDLNDASSPDYDSVMLHQTVSNGSTSKMEMVHQVTVPAHGMLNVAPGGYHFMLEGAKHPIKPGDTVKLELHFSDGAAVDTTLRVKSPAQAN
jgi:copper(I)-binding protein